MTNDEFARARTERLAARWDRGYYGRGVKIPMLDSIETIYRESLRNPRLQPKT